MKVKKGRHNIKSDIKTLFNNKWINIFSVLLLILFVFQLSIILNSNRNIQNTRIIAKNNVFKSDPNQNSIETVREPYLLEGMEAIYYDENNNEQKLEDPLVNKSKWYNYEQKRWANAKTKDGSYWVWIPAFAYKITYYSDRDTKEIIGYRDNNGFPSKPFWQGKKPGISMDVKFISKDVKDLKSFNQNSDYIIHPAFYKGDYISDGFWVAKHKASEGEKPEYKPNKQMANNISISEAFKKVEAGTNPGNPYGLDEEYAQMTLPQNKDIGALLYLTISPKGKQSPITHSKSWTTTLNPESSTTGNKTGVFDLNSNLEEWTMSLKENPKYNGEGSEKKNLENAINSLKGKRIHERHYNTLVEEYPYAIDPNVGDETRERNKEALIANKLVKYGDAMYETDFTDVLPGMGASSNQYLFQQNSFIVRGSNSGITKNASRYLGHTGKADENVGFRSVIYIYPYNLNKNVKYTFNILDGKIKVGDKVESHKKVTITGTKQSVYPNMISIVESEKQFKKWEPFNPNGRPMLQDTTFTPVFYENNEPEPQELYDVVFKDAATGKIYYKTKVKHGEKVNMQTIPTPTKDGYTFKRWSPNPENTTIYSEYEFKAVFEKNNTLQDSDMCIVTYKAEDGVFANNSSEYKVKVKKGSYAPYLPEDPNELFNQEVDGKLKNASHPIRKGYVFTGWLPPINETVITGDRVFTATYMKMPNITNQDDMLYKLRIDLNGGHSQMFTNGQTFNIIDLIYGGDLLLEKKDFSKKILSNIESDKPKKNGMKFSHWELMQKKKENNEIEFVYKAQYVNENEQTHSELNAKFNYCTVIYDASGGVWNSLQGKNIRREYIKKGDLLGKVEMPTRNGYIFNGWYTALEQEIREDTKVTESMKLYARWTNLQDYGTPDPPQNNDNNDNNTYIPDNSNTPTTPTKPNNNFNTNGGLNPYNPPKGTTPITTTREEDLPVSILTEGNRPSKSKVDNNLPESGLKHTIIGVLTITFITGLMIIMYISKQKIQYIDKTGGISAK